MNNDAIIAADKCIATCERILKTNWDNALKHAHRHPLYFAKIAWGRFVIWCLASKPGEKL